MKVCDFLLANLPCWPSSKRLALVTSILAGVVAIASYPQLLVVGIYGLWK